MKNAQAYSPRVQRRSNPRGRTDWSALTCGDLRAIHRILAENHPGPLDGANTAFRAWHEKGLTAALHQAREVKSFAGYYFGIRFYVAGFRDSHLTVSSRLQPEAKVPRFLLAFRNDDFVIREFSDPTNKSARKVLISCDGRSPRELMLRNIFPFAGNPTLEASWIEWTPWLLVDRSNPWIERPIRYVRESEGRRVSALFKWRKLETRTPDDLVRRSQSGPSPPFAARSFARDCVWISLPTFRPTDEVEAAKLNEIIKLAPSFRRKRIIVLDVRGNRGGNSQWGDDLVRALYGKSYFDFRKSQDNPGTYAEWRVSHGNELYLRRRVNELRRQFARNSPIIEMLRRVVEKMHDTRRRPREFCSDGIEGGKRSVHKRRHNPIDGQVFLLTDGWCGSACLDFADTLFLMGGIEHVGLTTNADSLYADVRSENLPSGISQLTFAMKVYRNRARGNNVPYTVKHKWRGEISDTVGLENWIIELARS